MPFESNRDDPFHQTEEDMQIFSQQTKLRNMGQERRKLSKQKLPDQYPEPCFFFAFKRCKFKNKCSRLHKIPQPNNSDLNCLKKDMEVLKQENIKLKAELDTMKVLKEKISKMNDEVFGLAAMFKEMDANHCKIKEDCEKREPKLTTNFRRNIPVRQRR